MAGHSKWANIQHRKKAQDAKRGKVFTKLIREVTVAARMGGGDIDANPRLRAAIDKARAANMTNDTIERAVKRGAGGLEGDNIEEIRYEGYGPHGVAVLVDCLSDNRNRTVSDVRHAFTKCGGNLGTDGSVAYLFSKKGQLLFAPGTDEAALTELALETEIDDLLANDDGSLEILTDPIHFEAVLAQLSAGDFVPDAAEITQIPATTVSLTGEPAEQLARLLDLLEDSDDVQTVYHNAIID